MQNAASTLFRLQRLGVDVGNRWDELADKAEARIGDCVSAFTLPHWLMALTATGRTAAAERMIEAMRAFANGRGTVPRIVRDYALPIAEAQFAYAAGRYADAVALMRPAIGGMYELGGSPPSRMCLSSFSWTPPSRPAAPRISASPLSVSLVAGQFRPTASSAGAKPLTGRRSGRHKRDMGCGRSGRPAPALVANRLGGGWPEPYLRGSPVVGPLPADRVRQVSARLRQGRRKPHPLRSVIRPVCHAFMQPGRGMVLCVRPCHARF